MPLRVALVVPHIFMQNDILPNVIFSPGQLAIDLANALVKQGLEITLFASGEVQTQAKLATADLGFFQEELARRDDTYISLLKKHPLTFITLARQAQASLVADAYQRANNGEFDVVHIYTNEEDIALPFAQFCKVPVVFTHHDPFNFLVGYRNTFPKYKHLNWLSISNDQRRGMPQDTNWIDTIYHGLDETLWPKQTVRKDNYVAFIGRIIEPKGLDIAIKAVQLHNKSSNTPLKLKIAGKHYSSTNKASYWSKNIEPLLKDPQIEYVGFINDIEQKQSLLAHAKALLVPSVFAEPFGMVMLEALACSTPTIGLNSGAIPEVIKDGVTGFIAEKELTIDTSGRQVVEPKTIENFSSALHNIDNIRPSDCRAAFENKFTLRIMALRHKNAYERLSGVY